MECEQGTEIRGARIVVEWSRGFKDKGVSHHLSIIVPLHLSLFSLSPLPLSPFPLLPLSPPSLSIRDTMIIMEEDVTETTVTTPSHMPHPLMCHTPSLQIGTIAETGVLLDMTNTENVLLITIETGHLIDTVAVVTETGHLTTTGGCGSRCGLVLLTLCPQEQ